MPVGSGYRVQGGSTLPLGIPRVHMHCLPNAGIGAATTLYTEAPPLLPWTWKQFLRETQIWKRSKAMTMCSDLPLNTMYGL